MNNLSSFVKNYLNIPFIVRTYFITLIVFQLLDFYYEKWAANNLSSNFLILTLLIINYIYLLKRILNNFFKLLKLLFLFI